MSRVSKSQSAKAPADAHAPHAGAPDPVHEAPTDEAHGLAGPKVAAAIVADNKATKPVAAPVKNHRRPCRLPARHTRRDVGDDAQDQDALRPGDGELARRQPDLPGGERGRAQDLAAIQGLREGAVRPVRRGREAESTPTSFRTAAAAPTA